MIDNFKKNVSLKDFNTFRVGGEAKYFFEPQTEKELIDVILWAKEEKVPFFVLGGGSNILVPDTGYDGLVLKLNLKELKIEGEKVFVSSSVRLTQIQGLSGLEWSAGIPGITVGGALYMNAGAFGTNMADITEEVRALDVSDQTIKKFSFEQCEFDYKSTVFKKNKNLIILSCVLKLEKKDKEEIERETKRVIDYRREHHPILPSAGSVFKNPFNMPAGEAIEKAGLKGKRIRDAMVSEQHCNFIVNMGNASYKDIVSLINLVKKQVKDKLNINLEEEIQIL